MNAANELLTFIENSPSMFHSIETIKGMLDEAGFTYLPESARWDTSRCVPPTVIHRLTR